MKPLLVTSGEPAGIGPDLCLDLAGMEHPLVVLADRNMLIERAIQLGRSVVFDEYQPGRAVTCRENHLTVWHIPCAVSVFPGVLNADNAAYVINMLTLAVDTCLQGEFSAVVTGPVHKGIINEAGFVFTGHTEFFSARLSVDTVVMMLSCDVMKVALITTHLPLRCVADAITQSLIIEVVTCLNASLQRDFAIKQPKIFVAGLNPHAGEGGYLGMEEFNVISPALEYLNSQGIDARGPFSADTLFTEKNRHACDVFVAMYHDQGLCVLKYAGFGNAVNITLGLPIVRTSVDHGTALELAGTGKAQSDSMISAIKVAAQMVRAREHSHEN